MAANTMTANRGSRKALQRAGANVSFASADKSGVSMLVEADAARAMDQNAASERCADNIMSKFNAMGSKAKAAKKTS